MSEDPEAIRARDERYRAHDRHRHWVPALVVGFLLLLTYLWTDWFSDHPPPGLDALLSHPLLEAAFSSHGHLLSNAWIHFGESALGTHAEVKILMLVSAVAFLLFYYLPPGLKRPPVVLATLLGVGWVFGVQALAALLAWYFAAFLTFHAPDPGDRRATAALLLVSLCAAIALAGAGSLGPIWIALLTAALGAALVLFYRHVYAPLLRTRARSYLQGSIANASLIYIAVALLWNGFTEGGAFPRPLGFIVFFWQWERMVMYWMDLEDGRIPEDLPIFEYLATFFSPGFLANVGWNNRIPKGYAYVAGSFLARDKNRIVLSGLNLLALSVVYFAMRGTVLEGLTLLMETLGFPAWTSYNDLIGAMHAGAAPTAASVWLVLIYAFLNFFMLWAGVAHLKVGLWRLVGYDIAPHFQKPFLSTNLIEWWKRYSYYYREFLMQAFYLPVFLRCFRKRPVLRVFVATLAAAGFGNLVFHIMESCLETSSTPAVWAAQLRTLPYYVLIGGAIGMTQIWIHWRGRSRRRPWTGRWRAALDVLAVVGTVGFFVLVRPFHHVPLGNSLSDCGAIVLTALGAGAWR